MHTKNQTNLPEAHRNRAQLVHPTKATRQQSNLLNTPLKYLTLPHPQQIPRVPLTSTSWHHNINTTLIRLIDTLRIPEHLDRTDALLRTFTPQVLRDGDAEAFLGGVRGGGVGGVGIPGLEVGGHDGAVGRADVDDGDVGVAGVRSLDVEG